MEKRPSAPVTAVLSPMATVSRGARSRPYPTTRPVTSIADGGHDRDGHQAVSPGPALAVTVAVVWPLDGRRRGIGGRRAGGRAQRPGPVRVQVMGAAVADEGGGDAHRGRAGDDRLGPRRDGEQRRPRPTGVGATCAGSRSPGAFEAPHAWRRVSAATSDGDLTPEHERPFEGTVVSPERGSPRHIVAGAPGDALLICTARARGRVDCPESPDLSAPAGCAGVRGAPSGRSTGLGPGSLPRRRVDRLAGRPPGATAPSADEARRLPGSAGGQAAHRRGVDHALPRARGAAVDGAPDRLPRRLDCRRRGDGEAQGAGDARGPVPGGQVRDVRADLLPGARADGPDVQRLAAAARLVSGLRLLHWPVRGDQHRAVLPALGATSGWRRRGGPP